MPRLQELITTESETREQRDQALFNKIDHEVRVCIDAVEKERQQREEAEEQMLEMIKDMTDKIKIETDRSVLLLLKCSLFQGSDFVVF